MEQSCQSSLSRNEDAKNTTHHGEASQHAAPKIASMNRRGTEHIRLTISWDGKVSHKKAKYSVLNNTQEGRVQPQVISQAG